MAKNIDTVKTFLLAADNIADALRTANPRDDEFDDLLDKHTKLVRNALNYMDLQERISFLLSEMAKVEEETTPTDNITVLTPSPANWKTEKPTEEKTADDEPDFPTPEEDPYPDEETRTYTFDEVKEAFTKAAQDGVQVKPIINEMGYEKLSAAPEKQYAKLMEQLDLAIKEMSK